MPETTFKFLGRCLLCATCNRGLVVNFGNIKTEEKWHDLNLPINETESPAWMQAMLLHITYYENWGLKITDRRAGARSNISYKRKWSQKDRPSWLKLTPPPISVHAVVYPSHP